jgi:hypothetical protein
MRDIITKIESILWAEGLHTAWNADTARAIAELLQAEGYGPGGSRPQAPVPAPAKRGRKGAGMPFSAAVAALVKLIPAGNGGNKGKPPAYWQTVLVSPDGVRLLPSAGESFAVVAETGLPESVAVDGRLFAGALKGITTPALSIRGNALVVAGGGLETSLPILHDMTAADGAWRVRDLPEPDLTGAVTWHPVVMQAIQQVARVASTDQTRASITRVLVEAEAVVATDGHRMEVRYITTHLDKPFAIPQDAIALLSSTKEPVAVAVKGGSVWLHSGPFMVQVPNERDFPAWRQVLPKDDEATLVVVLNRGMLRDFCKRVPKAEVAVQPVIMTLSAHDTAVRLQSAGMRADDIAACYGDVKQTMHVGFNASYMLSLLEGLTDGDFFELRLVDQFTPMTVRAPRQLHVLMPARI